jgi:hypothetical protein
VPVGTPAPGGIAVTVATNAPDTLEKVNVVPVLAFPIVRVPFANVKV